MKQFICISAMGKLIPLVDSQKGKWDDLLARCKRNNLQIRVTLEPHTKPISLDQKTLYNAFIIRLVEHFGNSFKEMEESLHELMPIDPKTMRHKPAEKWTTEELDKFIEEVKVYVGQIDDSFDNGQIFHF